MSNKQYITKEQPDGDVIGDTSSSLIGWYGGTPTAQLAHQANATDTTIVALMRLTQAWMRANGMTKATA